MFELLSALQWAVTASILTYILILMLGRGLAKRRGEPIGAAFHIFAVLMAFRIGAPVYLDRIPAYEQATWWKALEAVAILSGAFVFVKVFSYVAYDVYIPRVSKLKVPRLVHDITSVVVLAISFSVVLKVEFDLSLAAILTTSTILAATVGLAMQELLSNLIAGITLQFEKPFKVGDWIRMDGLEGEVVGITWRATRFYTTDGQTIVVPNGSIAKGMLTNFTAPTPAHALLSTVGVDYHTPPNRVKDCLVDAALNCPEVLRIPAPIAKLVSFGESSVTYELKFWIVDHARARDITDAVMTRFWYALKRDGISIPFPIRSLRMEKVETKEEALARQREAALKVLSKVTLFECLSPDQITALADRGKVVLYGCGEVVVRQGDTDQSLFVIEEGEADVEIVRDGTSAVVAVTLGRGEYFGEMSLLTGESRSATVRARRDLLLLQIDKDDIAPILAASPALVEEMSKVLAQRRMLTEGVFREQEAISLSADVESRYRERFVGTIRRFFKLAS